MKYIEFPELSRLAQALTHEGPECSVHTRLEAYSCKNIKRDKKLFKSLETAYTDELSNSPPLPSWLAIDREVDVTPFGPIDKHASRKTLYLLIATLNIAFPDYEFSDVRPAHFNKEESGASVLNSLSTTLLSPHRAGMRAPRTYSSYPPTSPNFFPSSVPTSSSPMNSTIASPYAPPQIVSGTHPTLYRILDDVIGLTDCEVFSYAPDIDSDPHANDFSDDEDDVVSIGDEYSSDDGDDGATFDFDDYDVDDHPYRSQTHRIPFRSSTADSASSRSQSDSPPKATSNNIYALPSYPHIRMKRRGGALLWSSHWFFLNRKLKRILFISVWAHTKGANRSWADSDVDEEMYIGAGDDKIEGLNKERFFGWEGDIGAGARAMGLTV
ncbi:hypothetical protein SERLA73DRAFT_160551 [Serpula lacrymans var. lacrymans S7.3]|uniref:Repressor of RNA polymerase III transcription MAF1 n=2 Tax=Serpula lacrymans var. lacrymans TaxID=341189 RepID=F8PYJ0_SERL3|nr:uncharacterized protein SERLADRAFT_468019 [Serpula lacrymans var. lacrymans S7.9]EGN98953.1 hypothetical protein SERLA73DRAFT_160551 [Serpula lacrymans var. lacrymans S7.3]EGO24542.1 hypothetical protein SERLADRAFT_468019 [Serpula lacrymans var. lacrymans S7.9]